MLIERLQDPCSKRSSFYNQQEYVNLPAVALHHLYRALDKLAAHNVLIQQQIFQTGRVGGNKGFALVSECGVFDGYRLIIAAFVYPFMAVVR